uniref:Uncharacterized protein n=1 Tax=Cannabis sativa TaxID=3483 RepID=A0A803NH50_CANSA
MDIPRIPSSFGDQVVKSFLLVVPSNLRFQALLYFGYVAVEIWQQRNSIRLFGGSANLLTTSRIINGLFAKFSSLYQHSFSMTEKMERLVSPSREGIDIVILTNASWSAGAASIVAVMTIFADGSRSHFSLSFYYCFFCFGS